MTIRLKYNTANQVVPLGHFVAASDGNTAQTALTIANTDIKIWKNGATSLSNKESGGATHMAEGVYYATLSANDTNACGPLVLFVHAGTSLPVRLECEVLPANWIEAMKGNEWLSVAAMEPDFNVSAGVLTVKKTDGATTQFTKNVATNANAQLIVGAD